MSPQSLSDRLFPPPAKNAGMCASPLCNLKVLQHWLLCRFLRLIRILYYDTNFKTKPNYDITVILKFFFFWNECKLVGWVQKHFGFSIWAEMKISALKILTGRVTFIAQWKKLHGVCSEWTRIKPISLQISWKLILRRTEKTLECKARFKCSKFP